MHCDGSVISGEILWRVKLVIALLQCKINNISENLFEHMLAVCGWFKLKIMADQRYRLYASNQVHHLPNYIALLANKTDCEDIDRNDVRQFESILQSCVDSYKNQSLYTCMHCVGACHRECLSIPLSCRYHQHMTIKQDMTALLYNVFYYLTDSELQSNAGKLTWTASVVQTKLPGDVSTMEYLYDIYEEHLTG